MSLFFSFYFIYLFFWSIVFGYVNFIFDSIQLTLETILIYKIYKAWLSPV